MAEELVRKDVNLRTAEIDLAAIGDIFLTLGEPFLDVGNLDKRKDLGANAHDWMSLMCQFALVLVHPTISRHAFYPFEYPTKLRPPILPSRWLRCIT